ncbi:hypothetical protein INT43_004983 [Umbelopsis isabellina]|uniref:Uncharacterized protein n=1 Tax=Mortierella isabellina TaxID=91625 RepID=A0A8H7PFM8_MORIS|nr:hypothetical protein INT43_004983 [Umbelopsis isabellina]
MKRMTQTEIADAILDAVVELGVSEPPTGYWKITHYAFPDTSDGPGHHWIEAEPLTGPGGDFDGTVYLKAHLGSTVTDGDFGIINTKITVSTNSGSKTGATVIDSGETSGHVSMITMGQSMGEVLNDNFKDGANYVKYNTANNCQGFSACQFDKIANQYFKKVDVGCLD